MKPSEVLQLYYAEIAEENPQGDELYYAQDGPVNEFLCFFLLVIHEDIHDKEFIRRYASTVRNIVKADQGVALPDDLRFSKVGDELLNTYADLMEYELKDNIVENPETVSTTLRNKMTGFSTLIKRNTYHISTIY